MRMSDLANMPPSIWEGNERPAGGELNVQKNKTLRISLKQWRMFHAVIDFDGFAEAAEHLHVSQSSISHALAKLQEQLGLSLLTLQGRKARITEEGKILLDRSRDLVRNSFELEDLAEQLRHGWGPELRLAVDPNFPPDLFLRALRDLSSSRRIRLRVQEATSDQALRALHDGMVDFAIGAKPVPGTACSELIGIENVAVAHPDNPLFALKRELRIDDLNTQCQVTISGYNDYVVADERDHLPSIRQPWNVSSLDRAVATLGQGIGYAWLPKYRLQPWLQQKQLKVLPVVPSDSRLTRLYLICGRSVSTNPSAIKFGEALVTCGGGVF